VSVPALSKPVPCTRTSAFEWFMAFGQHTAGSQASAGAEKIGL
jgi:hypothetical protein